MKYARWLIPTVALCLVAVAARPARASLLVALDLPTMVSRAEHVAVADVVSVQSAWDERRERILTTIDLAVVETWKGSAAPATHVSIVQRGGSVGDTIMTVFGMPQFSPGERVLVFLEGGLERARVVGMAQGKRPMRQETTTGRWLISAPERAGAAFIRPTPSSRSPVFETRVRPLDEVRDEIRSLVTAGKGR